MNSILQCLSNTQSLRDYCLHNSHRRDLNNNSRTNTALMEGECASAQRGSCRSYSGQCFFSCKPQTLLKASLCHDYRVCQADPDNVDFFKQWSRQPLWIQNTDSEIRPQICGLQVSLILHASFSAQSGSTGWFYSDKHHSHLISFYSENVKYFAKYY